MNTEPVVLIVDDEETIRKLLKARFERDGFRVVTASSAEEARSIVDSTPDLGVIVTDIRMPGQDGLTLTTEVKASHKHLKIIVMTGHGEKSTAIRALRLGASDYLEKPFDIEEMTHAVNRTVNEYKLEMRNEEILATVQVGGPPAAGGSSVPTGQDIWAENDNLTSSYTVLKKKWSEAFEKEYLTSVLERHHGNVTAAAKEAAVDRSNFLRLLRRHHIDASVYRPQKKAS
jgi:DNA-binding NtrC family response regulator